MLNTTPPPSYIQLQNAAHYTDGDRYRTDIVIRKYIKISS